MKNEIKAVIQNIEWCRSVLKIKGEILFDDAAEVKPVFYEYNLKKELEPNKFSIDKNNKFFLSLRVLSSFDGKPIPSGDWYLLFKTKGGLTECDVDEKLKNKLNSYGPTIEKWNITEYDKFIIAAANDSFCALSYSDPDTGKFFLNVKLNVPAKNKTEKEKKADKKRIAKKLRKGKVFDAIFYFFSKKKKNGKRLFFTSTSRGSLSGNQLFVYNRLKERGLDKDFEISFSFKESLIKNRSFLDSLKHLYNSARADIIFVDDYQPEFFRLKFSPGVKIVQLWHACGAFKTVGLERAGNKGGASISTNDHKCYTHMTVSSELAVDHYAEAFGIDESRILPLGVARTDVFFDDDYKKATAKKVKKMLKIPDDVSNVILYAPTFRGNGMVHAWFPENKIDLERIADYCKKSNSIFIIKMHPFVKQKLFISEENKKYIIDASSYREVNDILFITDLLITDYSSVIYEFSLLKKPMIFYAFDLLKYEADRGFYEPYIDMVPGKIVKTFDELMESIENKDFDVDKLDKFIKKNFKYTDGKSTDRIIDEIILSK